MMSFRVKRGVSRLYRFWVYILASKTGTLYIGVTNDLVRRIYEHKNKLTSGFTALYNTDRLMYYEEFGDINQAIDAEKKIKGWTRQKKINLIRTMNPETKELSVSLEILPSFRMTKRIRGHRHESDSTSHRL